MPTKPLLRPPKPPPPSGHNTPVTPVLMGYDPVSKAALEGEQVEEATRKSVKVAPPAPKASI